MGTFNDFITSADSGTPVAVNYRGKASYKTCPGAFLSLVLYAAVLGYGVYMVVYPITPQVSQYKVYADR